MAQVNMSRQAHILHDRYMHAYCMAAPCVGLQYPYIGTRATFKVYCRLHRIQFEAEDAFAFHRAIHVGAPVVAVMR